MKNVMKFNPSRLSKLADWLNESKVGLRIEILEDSSNTFKDKQINLVPIFITPIRKLPSIFKDEWEFAGRGEVVWKKDSNKNTISSLQSFFGIDCDALMHLFAPYAQSGKFGGKILRNNATPQDLAFNILEMIKVNNNVLKLNPNINIFISKN